MLKIRLSTKTRRTIQSFVVLASLFLIPGAQSRIDAQTTNVLDNSALHPPAGANLAIVEFSDPECPACARVNPLLKEAAAKYKIPWIRHDLIIQAHPWSLSAAVYARWFESKGNGLGDTYRDAVFANQSSIYNVKVLDQFTQNFARSHSLDLPFALDPQNKLATAAKADSELSRRTGVTHTPTIYIVTAHSKGAPYIEVQNPDRDLYRTIDQALADTKTDLPQHRTSQK